MFSGGEMYKVREGRVFVREAAVNRSWRANVAPGAKVRACMVIGMIAVPAGTDVERMHSARLNSNLWMDVRSASRPQTYMAESDIRECDLGHLLTQLEYREHLLPDSMDLFVRASFLPHRNESMRWVFVAGVVIGRPPELDRDGLYDLDDGKEGVRLVREEVFMGEPPSVILRKPMWGEGGQFGTVTCMEPKAFKAWLPGERARTTGPNGDPMFAKYVTIMQQRCPALDFYTADQDAQRERVSRQVMREVMSVQAA